MHQGAPSPAGRGFDPEPRWTLDPRVRHLNHGSFGAVPEAVQAEQDRLRRIVDWNPVRWFAALPERIAAARRGWPACSTSTPLEWCSC